MEIKYLTDRVQHFQQSFRSTHAQIPRIVSEDIGELRFDLMEEENIEYLQAIKDQDIIGVADALGDMLYILMGSVVTHGMQDIIGRIFSEIHDSNMSKLDLHGNPIINGENGVYDPTRPIGKVLKSEKYSKPNLELIVSRGIMAKKELESNKIWNLILQEQFLFKCAETPEKRAECLDRIEDLNQRLLKLSISKADLILK